MLIKETIERECCQHRDLRIMYPKQALGKRKDEIERMDRYCIHCGQEWEYYRFMDAAGSMDWDYRRKKDA